MTELGLYLLGCASGIAVCLVGGGAAWLRKRQERAAARFFIIRNEEWIDRAVICDAAAHSKVWRERN